MKTKFENIEVAVRQRPLNTHEENEDSAWDI